MTYKDSHQVIYSLWRISDETLIIQFNRISELTEENKTVVSKLIDAFLFQQER